jgi:hypothetical protein
MQKIVEANEKKVTNHYIISITAYQRRSVLTTTTLMRGFSFLVQDAQCHTCDRRMPSIIKLKT